MLSRRKILEMLGWPTFASFVGRPFLNATSAMNVRSGAPAAFEEIPLKTCGISWVHDSGPSPDMFLPETTGPGCAFLDYDNDGWMDIYLVNSGPCDFYKPKVSIRNALYRNNRDGTFSDVTEKAGVTGNAYGMGIAVGDYDGDGLPDLYVSQYPHGILYHNNGDGTFTDVTAKAGVAAPGMGTSAVWFDYDNDGRLDLFVGRFGNFEKSTNIVCMMGSHTRVYCKPTPYQGRPCYLFHNNGDGSFTDVSKESGIAAAPAKAWGVVAADINNDGWMDLFVSNDTLPNFLFANRRGHFEEIGLLSGVGLNMFGLSRSSMGVDAADYDQDGWIDLFVTNVDHELYSLYHNNHDESFNDLGPGSEIGQATRLMSGWGMKFFDYDNDGNLDLLVCNGHPDPSVEERFPELRYEEPMLLFRQDGKTFKNVSAQSGSIFSKRLAGRGMALGDFDNDGSVDLLIVTNDGPPALLRNNAGRSNHWLGIRLIGTKANIDAVGAKISYQAGDLRRHVFKVGGGSYLSSHDPRVVLGLGTKAKVEWLEIKWPKPSDRTERFTDLPADRYITIVEGQGKWK